MSSKERVLMLTRKHAFLLVFCIILTSILSYSIYAGCCVSTSSCDYEGQYTQSDCTGSSHWVASALDCYDGIHVPECEPVCCCFNSTAAQLPEITPLLNCHKLANYPYYTSDDLGVTPMDRLWIQRTGYKSLCEAKCNASSQQNLSEKKYNLSGYVFNATDKAFLSGATVYCPLEYGTIWDITDNLGHYALHGIPEGLNKIYVKKRDCIDNSTNYTYFDQDRVINLSMDCRMAACVVPNLIIKSYTQKEATASIYLEWNFTDDCNNLIDYIVTRCSETCKDFLANRNSYLTDEFDIKPNTQYCYNVTAVTATANRNAGPVCVTTGDLACMKPTPAQFCYNNTRASCANHRLIIQEDCGTKDCFTNLDGTTACIAQPECEKCNGIFWMFALLNQRLEVPGAGNFPCNQTVLTQCYFDRTQTSVDKYYGCSEILSCYNYMSEDSCSHNPCRLTRDCRWEELNQELGLGVCRPQDASEADCRSCTELYHEGCTKEVCSAFGNCYLHELSKGLSVYGNCMKKEEMACAYYDTEEDCINSMHNTMTLTPGNASVNVIWSGNVRIGGDHTKTKLSKDYFGFGTCKWVKDTSIGDSTNGRCVKDADNHATSNDYADDCIEQGITGFTCLGDNEPPNTTLLLKPSGNYKINEFHGLAYVVQDNNFPKELIETYFCTANPSESCYPNKPITEISITQTKQYAIYYYSVDKARNLEPVKKAILTLEQENFPEIINYTIT